MIFLHIPRTGGKTTKKLMVKEKIPGYIHFPCDYKEIEISKSQIFTIIREPTDRYKSEFKSYFQMYKKGGLPIEYRNTYMKWGITDYKSFVDAKITHNTQTKMLLGYKLYEKETITNDEANKVIERIERDEIIPLTFTCLLEIINELRLLNPNINENFFKVREMDWQEGGYDENVDDSESNSVDEYLYTTIITKYSYKIEKAKEMMREKILRIIN